MHLADSARGEEADVGLSERYLAAVRDVSRGAGRDGELSPTVLAQACCEVLPVEGAGITMQQQLLRLPLGSSDDTAAWVERLQATLGDGPCVDAMADNQPLVAGPASMMRCWPTYTPQVFARTPFRAVAVTPLAVLDEPVFGALSLFASTTDLGSVLDVVEVNREIGDLIAGILSSQLVCSAFEKVAGLDWLTSEAVTHRRQVWWAVAIIVGTAHVSETEALATLRRSARREGVTLDELAQRLFTQHDDPTGSDESDELSKDEGPQK